MFNATLKAKAHLPAAALAIALMIGACGSDDDANPDGGDSRHTGQAAEIDQVLQANQADYIAGDGDSFCARLTPAGRAQVETFGRTFRIGRKCEPIIAEVSRRSKSLKQKPTELVSVEITGNKATATVKDGGRKPEKLVFVKQNGEWKMPDPGFPAGISDDGSTGSGAGAKPPEGAPAVPPQQGGASGS